MNVRRIKEALKKSKLFMLLYNASMWTLFKLNPIISYEKSIILYYYLRTGKKINFENPIGFNQKIQWLKVYYRDPLVIQCTDKYKVREYVKAMGCGYTLNELIGVYENANEIDFDSLPNSFAIKCNHGCKTNIICNEKKEINPNVARKKLNKWLKQITGEFTGEKHYKYIKPRIIAEKYLGELDGSFPIDYKIYCFNGVPYCIGVFAGRDKGLDKMQKCFFDFNWRIMNELGMDEKKVNKKVFVKPDNLDEMYQVAKKLSSPFPFVRVDLYNINNTIIFGELTFTPSSGISKAVSEEGDILLGKQLKLPNKSHGTWDEVMYNYN